MAVDQGGFCCLLKEYADRCLQTEAGDMIFEVILLQ